MAKVRKLEPKVNFKIRLKPEIIEILRQGAAYHEIGYHVYTQWVLEEALKREIQYYGWKKLTPSYVKGKPGRPPNAEQDRKEINHLMRLVDRRLKAQGSPPDDNT